MLIFNSKFPFPSSLFVALCLVLGDSCLFSRISSIYQQSPSYLPLKCISIYGAQSMCLSSELIDMAPALRKLVGHALIQRWRERSSGGLFESGMFLHSALSCRWLEVSSLELTFSLYLSVSVLSTEYPPLFIFTFSSPTDTIIKVERTTLFFPILSNRICLFCERFF